MVFKNLTLSQKAYTKNVAFGPKINGFKSNEIEGIVETSLKKAALWDEVKG